MKEVCVHELFLTNDMSSPHLCAKVASENIIESTIESVETITSTTSKNLATPNNTINDEKLE